MTILINSQAVAKHKLLRDNAGTQIQVFRERAWY